MKEQVNAYTTPSKPGCSLTTACLITVIIGSTLLRKLCEQPEHEHTQTPHVLGIRVEACRHAGGGRARRQFVASPRREPGADLARFDLWFRLPFGNSSGSRIIFVSGSSREGVTVCVRVQFIILQFKCEFVIEFDFSARLCQRKIQICIC